MMIQFYFLSIVANFVGGALLASGFLGDRISFLKSREDVLDHPGSSKLVVGIIAIVVGLLKFLSVVEGDVKVVGDLLPALTGIAVGLALLSDHYQDRTDLPEESGFTAFIDKNKTIIGLISMGVAVAHFFIPRVLFL